MLVSFICFVVSLSSLTIDEEILNSKVLIPEGRPILMVQATQSLQNLDMSRNIPIPHDSFAGVSRTDEPQKSNELEDGSKLVSQCQIHH